MRVATEALHAEPEDVYGDLLTDAVAARHGLVFDGGVPVWAKEINLAELLEVQALAAHFNLEEKHILGAGAGAGARYVRQDSLARAGRCRAVNLPYGNAILNEAPAHGLHLQAILDEHQLQTPVILARDNLFRRAVNLAVVFEGGVDESVGGVRVAELGPVDGLLSG